MNLTTATPVEIDTMLAANMETRYEAQEAATRAADMIRWYANGGSHQARPARQFASIDEALTVAREEGASWDQRRVTEAEAQYEAAVAAYRATIAADRPLVAEYASRPWTRAYLVNNSNGHVHSSMHCSTCFEDRVDFTTGQFKRGTFYQWMVQYSGSDEAQIVADAGERACTVCYPSAPVESLNRPTKMFTDDEVAAAKAREERAEAKRVRDAKRIEKALTPDGSEFKVSYVWLVNENGEHVRNEYFKTEQAGTQFVVSNLVSAQYGYGRSAAEASAVAQVVEAIRVKHNWTQDEVDAHIAAKVAAKIKRDGR